jgi:ribosomal protein S12 methylthiotransferase
VKERIYLINLGCPKNLVDSEIIISSLQRNGFVLSTSPEGADFVIINTCGFIKGAVEEAKGYIEEFLKKKRKGEFSKLLVAGCLPERFKESLLSLYPDVDYFVGVNDILKIPEILKGKNEGKIFLSKKILSYDGLERTVSTYPYAYLKISEGCSKKCSFCTIPSIRGKYRSRKIEDIKKECESLVEKGYREIILISQDTTFYGVDIYGRPSLTSLLSSLEKIEGLKWVRLLYCYPRYFEDALIKKIRDSEKIVKYIDIPIQHISKKILKLMKRGTPPDYIKKLVEKLRREIDGVFLRTSLIVGFPGENKRDFEELKKFIVDYPFDYLGVFPYSDEEGTEAFNLKKKLKKEEIEERAAEIYDLQRKISRKLNRKRIGKVYDAIVDGRHKEREGVYIARIYGQAPEIDSITYLQGRDLKAGEFLKVKIIKAFDYDLEGEVLQTCETQM